MVSTCWLDLLLVWVCVCIYMCVWGLVVKWFVHWAHDPWVMGSSPTTRRWILSNLLPLPPTTPTSPPSCELVPGVSWGANHSSFSLTAVVQVGLWVPTPLVVVGDVCICLSVCLSDCLTMFICLFVQLLSMTPRKLPMKLRMPRTRN